MRSTSEVENIYFLIQQYHAHRNSWWKFNLSPIGNVVVAWTKTRAVIDWGARVRRGWWGVVRQINISHSSVASKCKCLHTGNKGGHRYVDICMINRTSVYSYVRRNMMNQNLRVCRVENRTFISTVILSHEWGSFSLISHFGNSVINVFCTWIVTVDILFIYR